MNDITFVWNAALTGVVGLLMYFMRGKLDELKEARLLLAATREEFARNSISRAEFNEGLRTITGRIDVLTGLVAKLPHNGND